MPSSFAETKGYEPKSEQAVLQLLGIIADMGMSGTKVGTLDGTSLSVTLMHPGCCRCHAAVAVDQQGLLVVSHCFALYQQ